MIQFAKTGSGKHTPKNTREQTQGAFFRTPSPPRLPSAVNHPQPGSAVPSPAPEAESDQGGPACPSAPSDIPHLSTTPKKFQELNSKQQSEKLRKLNQNRTACASPHGSRSDNISHLPRAARGCPPMSSVGSIGRRDMDPAGSSRGARTDQEHGQAQTTQRRH